VDGIKTPFIVRYPPWIPPGQSTGALVSSIDIAPTVLEMAGIQRPDRFQGVSLVPVLKDPRTEVRELAFAEHNWHDYRAFERAVVSKEHLLIHNWLPDLPATPPADAVRSPTYREMQRMRGLGELTALQSDVFAVPRPTVEMYAWTEDTNCLTNLADVEQQAAVKQRLLMELAAWQQWTQDCVPDAESLTADRFDRTSGLRLDD
jgi:arylsulfatase A-like enzyme